jgi:hypothetical protein
VNGIQSESHHGRQPALTTLHHHRLDVFHMNRLRRNATQIMAVAEKTRILLSAAKGEVMSTGLDVGRVNNCSYPAVERLDNDTDTRLSAKLLRTRFARGINYSFGWSSLSERMKSRQKLITFIFSLPIPLLYTHLYSSGVNSFCRSAHLSTTYTPASHPPDLFHLLESTVRSLTGEELRVPSVSAKGTYLPREVYMRCVLIRSR